MKEPICLFALERTRAFGEQMSRHLALPLSELEERLFVDGEHKIRPITPVRGKDIYVVHALHSDLEQSVNDKLCRLLFFLGALKDASAQRVTALLPYLCYARKDQRTKPQDPVTTRYIACLFEAMGVDQVVTLEVHNRAAYDNAFGCPKVHLDADDLFATYFATILADHPVVVVSPDVGGIKRAERFRQQLSQHLGLSVEAAFMEKQRSGGVVSGQHYLVGPSVTQKAVIILDDMISSGTTMIRAAQACHQASASRIYAAATHGLFVGKAEQVLDQTCLDAIVITNSIPPFRLSQAFIARKLVILDASLLFADTIRLLHEDG